MLKHTITVFAEQDEGIDVGDVATYAVQNLEGYLLGRCTVEELSDIEALRDPDYPAEVLESIFREAGYVLD